MSNQQQRRGIRTPGKRQASVAVRQDQFWKWPREQYEPFMRQLHQSICKPPEPAPATWLSPETLRPALIQVVDQSLIEFADHFPATWSWVVEHPAFQPLKDDANFRRAWLTFQDRHGLSPAWETPKDCGAACRFVYLVALWHGVCSVPGISAVLNPRNAKGAPVRTDKARKKVRGAIESLERHLADGVIPFDSASDEKLLEQLLAQAKSTLARPGRKPPSQQMELFHLAHFVVSELGVVNSTLFMEIATAVGLTCDERAAQRYLKQLR
ncbi:MAG TPA: hypothetical protein VFX20_15495 [Steroidobacteraceae bacterium]|nr:hypothetical protein [Steroidobacteraceae bacterium]